MIENGAKRGWGDTVPDVSVFDQAKTGAVTLAPFRDRAPWWGGDLQTLRNHLLPPHGPLPATTATRVFETSDGSGDRLIAQVDQPTTPVSRAPLIVLIHGLTGCEDSTYVRRAAQFHLLRGRTVLRLNLRGAGPARGLAKGNYHAGSAPDIQDVLERLGDDETRDGVFLVGFSLGGNILLNLLAALPVGHRVIGAATVSAPIEPLEACRRIMAPRNALYHRWLLQRMKQDVLASGGLSAGEQQAVERARSVFEFDDRFVGPRNGFRDAIDYYERTAGARRLPDISVPTLMLHARNDPWIPVRPYVAAVEAGSTSVNIMIAQSGGHVGFHERGYADAWHDRMIDAFLMDLVAGPAAQRDQPARA